MSGHILGIDPGLDGALCFIDTEDGTVNLFDMPTFTIEKPLTAAQKKKRAAASAARYAQSGKVLTPEELLAKAKGKKETSSRRFINHDDLGNILRFWSNEVEILTAIIEQVASRPTDGGIQAFAFGMSYCAPIQACADFQIPRQNVTPNVWKKDMKLSGDKDESRQLATRLAPGCAHLWHRAMDDGRAESFLIGIWGMRQLGLNPLLRFKPSAICSERLAA